MKREVAAALLFVLIASLVWLIGFRRPPSMTPSSHDLPALAQASPRQSSTSSKPAEAEGNPDFPEDTAETNIHGAGAGPVVAPPAAAVLAAMEELPVGPEPAEEGSVQLPPATALENVRTLFRQYSQRFGGNPVGNNPEITAALNGQNARQIVFIHADDGALINRRGELVDSWNSPYFFHQLSGTKMEIRSAGADRRMWTADDLVIR